MPDNVISSMERMQEALRKLPKADAESIAAEAAARAEAVADYAEQIGRAQRPGA